MNALSPIKCSSVATFISPRTFTEITSLSRFKLMDLIKFGHIRARRADGRILVEVASVNEYLAALPAETFAKRSPPQIQTNRDLFAAKERTNA